MEGGSGVPQDEETPRPPVFFVKDQSELGSPKLDSGLSSSSELEEELEESELPWECSKKVEHAFCAASYASSLFFPVHLS